MGKELKKNNFNTELANTWSTFVFCIGLYLQADLALNKFFMLIVLALLQPTSSQLKPHTVSPFNSLKRGENGTIPPFYRRDDETESSSSIYDQCIVAQKLLPSLRTVNLHRHFIYNPCSSDTSCMYTWSYTAVQCTHQLLMPVWRFAVC